MAKGKLSHDSLKQFCREIFMNYGLNREDSTVSADVLVTADMRGIPSHGVARLERYVNGLKEGLIHSSGKSAVLRESPVSLLVDAGGSMGAPVSAKTMDSLIEKAHKSGMAFGCVKNSNHYGIAGYYAMKALSHDMIGVSMTNTAALGVPTGGKKVMFGTNPMAFAAPAHREKAFVLDMSTTAVTRGKVEVYGRAEKKLEQGWAVDKSGKPARDPLSLLDDMFHRKGGGLVPLGGDSETGGGHKGYGLAVMIDILTGMLSESSWGMHIYDKGSSSARVSHCFGVMRIDLFSDPAVFKQNMDAMARELREMEPAEGTDQVYYGGLKEALAHERSLREGIELSPKVIESLKFLGKSVNVEFPR